MQSFSRICLVLVASALGAGVCLGCGDDVSGGAPTGDAGNPDVANPDVAKVDDGGGTDTALPDSSATESLTTEILGQSQTKQWFPYLTLERWQARIQTGSGYMDWRDPNHAIWSNPVTPGPSGTVPTSQIERVVLTIGKSPEDTNAQGTYESLVADCIATIRIKYPALKEIRLQPLAAGPNRELCTIGGKTVLTTKNLSAIETAIATLVGGDVVKGAVPLVDACSEFADDTGHLTPDGQKDVAGKVAGFYR